MKLRQVRTRIRPAGYFTEAICTVPVVVVGVRVRQIHRESRSSGSLKPSKRRFEPRHIPGFEGVASSAQMALTNNPIARQDDVAATPARVHLPLSVMEADVLILKSLVLAANCTGSATRPLRTRADSPKPG